MNDKGDPAEDRPSGWTHWWSCIVWWLLKRAEKSGLTSDVRWKGSSCQRMRVDAIDLTACVSHEGLRTRSRGLASEEWKVGRCRSTEWGRGGWRGTDCCWLKMQNKSCLALGPKGVDKIVWRRARMTAAVIALGQNGSKFLSPRPGNKPAADNSSAHSDIAIAFSNN